MNIKNTSCESVFYFFEKISQIPRSSGNEKQISDFLVSFAKERGLYYHQDNAMNVLIKKPASPGFEKFPAVVLQGHMDMVCVKNIDSKHNFDTDPIKLIYDGDFIMADGTSLGGDDGIAVAMALAVLDSDEIEHPPIEVLITVDEEVGMNGANAFDASLLEGRTLLNIDSEQEGVFTQGCAGGLKTETKFKVKLEKPDESLLFFKITVGGLKGGHSGIDIDKERGNAIKILARTVNELNKNVKLKLNSISGGAKDNAIAEMSWAVIGIDKSEEAIAAECIKRFEEKVKNELKNSDNGVFISTEKQESLNSVFSDCDFQNILKFMLSVPNGVQSLSTDIENLPESSDNIGIIKTVNDCVSVICSVRSSIASKKYYILDQIKALSELAGAEFSFKGDYPAWEFRKNSPLRDKMTDIYKKLFNTEPVIDIVHAGLECGIFAKKLPDMDMLSFGPNLYDIHTVKERMSISSVERTWKLLVEFLKSYSNK